MISKADAIASLNPGKPFVIYGDDPASIQWHIDGITTPTHEQIEAEIEKLENQREAARAASLAKLEALGLTPDDLAALIG